MKLNLDEFKAVDDATVTFGGEDFMITGNIPVSVMTKYQDISEDLTKGNMKKTIEWVSDLMKIKNDSTKVDKFVSKLDIQQLNKLVMFFAEYFNAVFGENKKKID